MSSLAARKLQVHTQPHPFSLQGWQQIDKQTAAHRPGRNGSVARSRGRWDSGLQPGLAVSVHRHPFFVRFSFTYASAKTQDSPRQRMAKSLNRFDTRPPPTRRRRQRGHRRESMTADGAQQS